MKDIGLHAMRQEPSERMHALIDREDNSMRQTGLLAVCCKQPRRVMA